MAFAAYLAELVGAPVTAWSVLGLLAVGAGALYGWRRRGGIAARAATAARPEESRPAEPRVAWLVLALPVVVYLLLHTLRDLVILPGTVDDGVHHATWTRLIFEKETLSPVAIYAPPVSDHRSMLYPWGFHVWIAMVAKVASLPWIETYWRSVLVIGSCLPLGVYVLATKVMPKGWPCVAAALCSVLFFWLPFQPYLWGGLPLLTGALCALPLARVALDAFAARDRAPVVLAAALGVGVFLVHPSQAMGALIVCAIVAVAQRLEQRGSWRTAAWCLGGLTVLGVVLTVGADHLELVNAFIRRAGQVAHQKGARPEMMLGWLRDLFVGRGPSATVLGVLCVLGVATTVWQPAFRVVLWLTLGLMLLLPLAFGRTWLTALWYHDLERLWYLQVAATPLLGAAGLWGVVTLLGRLKIRRLPSLLRPEVTWPVLVALVVGVSHSYVARVSQRLEHAPAVMPSDRSHLVDFAWIREHVPADALILNAPGDWGLVLPFTGRPLTFANCQVESIVPAHFEAFWALHDVGGYDQGAHQRLRALGVRYVYAGFFPDFAVATARGATFDTRELDLNPGLERVYQSRTAQIYRVRDELKAGFPQVQLGLGADGPAGFEGFAPVEQSDGRSVRWTTAESTIQVPAALLPECESCALVLGMWRPQHFPVEITWDGQPLRAVVEGVYPIPTRVDVLEIRARTFVPKEVDEKSDDGRALGVELRGLSIECAQTEDAGSPARTAVIPLGGSEDAMFLDFHPVERSPDSSWRWTKERSLIQLRDRGLPKGKHCVVNLALGGGSREAAVVRWNGTRLTERTPGTFPLGGPADNHRLTLSSRTQPRPGAPQPVGVGLWRVGFQCLDPAAR